MIRANRRQSLSLQREALDRLMHATSGNATVEDLRMLEAWRDSSPAHAEAYRNALAVWDALEAAGREVATAEDRARIAARPVPGTGPHALGRRAFLAGGLAASAAVVGVMMVRPPLGLWPSLSDLAADYHTQVGVQRTISLAEGVSVEMNSRTSIGLRSVPGENRQGDAIELISGEVAVSAACAADRPLVVFAGGGQTQSSQAKFDIRHNGGSIRVICLEGAVEVERAGARMTLRAREQASYSDRGIGPATMIDPAVVMAWQQGMLVFRDEPLAQVIDEVNRYWAGRIILLDPNLGRRRVTARIELARIVEVISYVQSALGAKVRTLPGGVVLLS
jgi:transmembrane sensor